MERTRAEIGFDEALADFDPADWATGQGTRPRIAPEESRRAAEALGFQSREPGRAPALGQGPGQGLGQAPGQGAETAPPRRRRTGRNAQLNLKVRPDTIAAFTALADRMGWGLGETLEEGLKLLQERHGT